jgi:enediyne biosynthesis protein E4
MNVPVKAIYHQPFKSVMLLLMVTVIFSCTDQKSSSAPLFTLMEKTGIDFRNDVKDTKVDNSFLFRNFYNGGGVALGDINNDGLVDVFLTSNQGENKLYLNKDSFQFEEISQKAGLKQDNMWSTGVTMVDINADGWLDIYVCSSGHMKDGNRKNKLYINHHNLTFTDSAAAYGLAISGYCTQAAFFDYDMDNDLDCFLINNSPIPFSSLDYAGMRDVDITNWTVDENLKGGGNHLYQNRKGRFVEVTKEAGLHTGLISFGLGVSVSDMNGDDYPDIYVGNDFIEKDYLYINQGNGTFRDELENRVQKISMSSMSTDVADINNDGYPEIFTTDMIPDDDYRLKTTGTFDNIDLYLSKQKAGLYHQYVRNCLQLNNGDGTFSEIANYAGTFGTDWSWGAVFFDADNDGFNDLFVCNGIARDVGDLDFLDFFSNEVYTKMASTGQRTEMDELLKHIPSVPLTNRVFRNKGNLSFEDAGAGWGFVQSNFSNSVAYADLDNDGDLDLVVNNENAPASVYRNNGRQQKANNFIAFQLKGKEGNPFAVGSKITVYKDGNVFCREVSPVRGFQSSMEYKQLIGLGQVSAIDSVVINWPDKSKTSYTDLPVNKTHIIKYEPAKPRNFFTPATGNAYVQVLAPLFDKHTEDDYIDFYYERNLPQMLSRQGPCIAKGDINGDGLEDIYIGGAKDQGGQLYVQSAAGSFVKKEEPAFKQYTDFEDVAVLFFDADGDKDLDLFIGAGGNNTRPGERTLEHRLYINDGRGAFKLNTAAFPANSANISTAVAYDYDGDGDEDLFVGGRSIPSAYGVLPPSYVYENDSHGNFTDVTAKLAPGIAKLGMVTAALWADVFGDDRKELVVTGEWMDTKVFTWRNNKLEAVQNTGLENLSGWWQSIAAADLNNDGLQDLIIGNIGENFYLRPDKDNPVKLWVADFDNNGNTDQFLTQAIDKRDMPVFLKRDITEQFPFLKKQNLKHSDYARKTMQDLFGNAVLSSAAVRTFNYCSSVVAINQGKGKFLVKPLPVRAQLSSINAIYPADINNDNKVDLLTGGNLFTFPPQFGRLDASYGDMLLNNGNGEFTWVDNKRSGISVKGEVKDIKPIKVKGKKHVVITQNNTYPVLYRLKHDQ